MSLARILEGSDGRWPALLLMGPTAIGKSELALALAERLPVSLISVDSAQVYRGMDIGTAKPSPDQRARHPHALVDIRDPARPYSAAEFVADAMDAMADARAAGRLPVLVGGTMLYFRALEEGIAAMPPADESVRAELMARAEAEGWPALHAELARTDPVAAERIHPNNPQRLQRALEVQRISGRPISWWWAQPPAVRLEDAFAPLRLALLPGDRAALHRRIEARLGQMFAAGFVDEVRALRDRGDLDPELPAIRAVGYRQVWDWLEAGGDEAAMRYRALVATRQLAKRQLTWLRGWPGLHDIEVDLEALDAGAPVLSSLLDVTLQYLEAVPMIARV